MTIRSQYQLCHVTTTPLDLYLGNYDTCDRALLPDCTKIHIFHESQPGKCKRASVGEEVTIDYREHDPLTADQIELIFQTAKASKTLFVHCAAGIGRSPTICVLALAARGMPPWTAMGIIAEAMWRQYAIPVCPSYDNGVLAQIFSYYDNIA